MSIIEKAVEKLEKAATKPASTTSSLQASVAKNSGLPNAPAETMASAQDPAGHGAKSKAATQREVLTIPMSTLADKGMITPAMPRSTIAEEYRRIKRPLLRNIQGDTAAVLANPNLIMVTSALQGDGKTFTAINLAMSIAMEQDKTVLFVDADVAKASAGQLLGVPDAHTGLIDVLENKGACLEEAIIPTNVPNLRIIPAGNVHERSTELLAGEVMQSLMTELASRYDDRVIIFDSPPLLMTSEAGVLASFMGQIAFVASTDETPQEAVTEALQHIGEDKAVGMILNKAHRRRSRLLGLSFGAGYKYGYGYEYGARERHPASGNEG